MRRLVLVVPLLACLFVATGCATTRGVIDVPATMGANPPSGPAVRIDRVTDRRVFEIDPRQANIPSLMNDAEIKDPKITSRAIARKRGGFGKALGDILLPEGRTVMKVVEEALTRSLQDAGYRVVSKQDPEAATAIPVEADIEQILGVFSAGVRGGRRRVRKQRPSHVAASRASSGRPDQRHLARDGHGGDIGDLAGGSHQGRRELVAEHS